MTFPALATEREKWERVAGGGWDWTGGNYA